MGGEGGGGGRVGTSYCGGAANQNIDSLTECR